MIDVARNIVAPAAIDRPFLVDAEKIFAVALFDFLIRHARARVLNDLFPFGNSFDREESQAGG